MVETRAGAFHLASPEEIAPGVDLLKVRVASEVLDVDIAAFTEALPRDSRRPWVLLVDASNTGGVSLQARERVLQLLRHPMRSLAVAVVSQAMLPRLVTTGFALVSRGGAMRAFQDEAPALRWLAEQANAALQHAEAYPRPA